MNFQVVRCRRHGCCCCPPPELLFVWPEFQKFPSLPPFPPLRLIFFFVLLLPHTFSYPPPSLFFKFWCWLCSCCCVWNVIWYVGGGVRLVIAWYIIRACCSCCCNCVLVEVNPDIVVWLLSDAKENYVLTAHTLHLLLWWLYQLCCLQNLTFPLWLRRYVWGSTPCSKTLLLRSIFVLVRRACHF